MSMGFKVPFFPISTQVAKASRLLSSRIAKSVVYGKQTLLWYLIKVQWLSMDLEMREGGIGMGLQLRYEVNGLI